MHRARVVVLFGVFAYAEYLATIGAAGSGHKITALRLFEIPLLGGFLHCFLERDESGVLPCGGRLVFIFYHPEALLRCLKTSGTLTVLRTIRELVMTITFPKHFIRSNYLQYRGLLNPSVRDVQADNKSKRMASTLTALRSALRLRESTDSYGSKTLLAVGFDSADSGVQLCDTPSQLQRTSVPIIHDAISNKQQFRGVNRDYFMPQTFDFADMTPNQAALSFAAKLKDAYINRPKRKNVCHWEVKGYTPYRELVDIAIAESIFGAQLRKEDVSDHLHEFFTGRLGVDDTLMGPYPTTVWSLRSAASGVAPCVELDQPQNIEFATPGTIEAAMHPLSDIFMSHLCWHTEKIRICQAAKLPLGSGTASDGLWRCEGFRTKIPRNSARCGSTATG
jgi:hypothetical protein